MAELLAPAGNMEAFKAAISNGCDAVYLGMQKFGARAYSSNFDEELLEEAVNYAHIRDVKVYVTMNTIVFEDEIEDMRRQLNFINSIGVDGVIVQDLAVFNYIVENFRDMEAHCSTQIGLDDLDGALLFKEMGAKRAVLSRELSIDEVKQIRKTAKIPIEIFIHGALCMSYSGNCLMSGLIGYRSGNRGRCVGSCRKPYELVNVTSGKSLGTSYILSTKDLNTIDYIDELRNIDSLKIEGRMKEAVYVANVVSKYRKALDNAATELDKEQLANTFNRTFTKGYLFGEDKKDIANIKRPNNYGYRIGTITGNYNGMYEISLKGTLNQNDIIRIDHNNEDVNLSLVKMYDKAGKLINHAEKVCYFRVKEKLSRGDAVYKTKDYLYNKELEGILDREYRRFPINFKVYAVPGAKLIVSADAIGVSYIYESEEILEKALKKSTGKEEVRKQLSKLNETVFVINDVEFEDHNAFIPVKLLNNARRAIVSKLYELKIASKERKVIIPKEKRKFTFEPKKPYITASVTTKEQYDICREMGIREIYFDNIVRRNKNEFRDREGLLLIGGYGGIHHYKDSNPFVTDYSLNVVNAESVRTLHELGASRVTLSYELNKKQISDLINSYKKQNGGLPSLEMIVYGRAPLMFTRYCPLNEMGQCGKCKNNRYELRDEHGSFPILTHSDCCTTILNGKKLNLLDEVPEILDVQAFRLNFTIEDENETENIIRKALGKLSGEISESVFDRKTDTRGHFNREIM